ncbi:MAG: 30S ribosomal protein S2, partial [Planctomycetota bacterium]
MTSINVKELLDAGVHFGHRVSRWNPKMAPYIHGKRNKIHILDLVETIKGLATGCHFLRELAATGRQVVLVGTKRQIKNVILGEAERNNLPYVNERWLGGTLTNFATIRSRLARLEELEEMEASGAMENYKK